MKLVYKNNMSAEVGQNDINTNKIKGGDKNGN
jgi:hypothetical protein